MCRKGCRERPPAGSPRRACPANRSRSRRQRRRARSKEEATAGSIGTWFGVAGDLEGIEITFQQKHRGQAVYRACSFFDADTALPQHPSGFHTGQTLIPIGDLYAGFLLQPFSKLAGVLTLPAFSAAHMEW